MGNEQSNTNTRTTREKVFRISRKEQNSGWFRCRLDDYVEYSDGNYKHIDFANEGAQHAMEFITDVIVGLPPTVRTPLLTEGEYISIDLNYTREKSNGYNFSTRSISVVGYERVDSEGNVSIFGLAGGIANEIVEARQRYAQIQYEARIQSQIAHRQTSFNLPPW